MMRKGQHSFSVKSNRGIQFILFCTSWSEPCKQQWEILKTLSKNTENDTEIQSIDIDRSPELADRWAIQSIPTTIVFDGQREIDRFIGLLSIDRLQDILADQAVPVRQVAKQQPDPGR